MLTRALLWLAVRVCMIKSVLCVSYFGFRSIQIDLDLFSFYFGLIWGVAQNPPKHIYSSNLDKANSVSPAVISYTPAALLRPADAL